MQCWQQPIELTHDIGRIGNITYIVAKGWGGENPPFISCYERAQARGWKALTVPCGHEVMLDQPEKLTALLIGTLEMPSDPV